MLTDDFTRGRLSLAIAVTGHRDLREADIPGFKNEIRRILAELKDTYKNTPLLLLSGLAEGADRIAVEVAQERDIAVRYMAILPMPEDLYRTDFTAESSNLEFERLRREADRCIALPLASGVTPEMASRPGEARDRQYTLLGEHLVRYSQILIAIWDRERGGKPGGTTEVVHLKLCKDSRSRRLLGARINAGGAGPVYILPARTVACGRGASGPGASAALRCEKEVPEGTTWEEYEACYRLLDKFNADLAGAGEGLLKEAAKSRKDLFAEGEPAGLSDATEWAVKVYSRADTLAVRYSSRGLRIWQTAFAMLALAGLCMALSHGGFPRSELFLYGYYACLAAALVLVIRERKTELRGRHEDYRALAEALRVQIFWMVTGLPDLAADRYLSKQAGEMVWIRDAISGCALYDGAPNLSSTEPTGRAARLRLARTWVIDEKDYFCKTEKQHHRKKRTLQIFGTVAAVAGLVLPLAGLFLINRVWAEVTAPLAMWWAALAWDYVERRGFAEEARRYARMYTLFRDAELDLKECEGTGEFGESEKILRKLGCEALNESADWLAAHRERKLSANLGAK